MVSMMSRRTTVNKVLHETNNGPDDLSLSLEGIALYTDRDGQPSGACLTSRTTAAEVTISPRRLTNRGQISLIKISPRVNRDTSRGRENQSPVSPRRKNKANSVRKGQISMIELQNLATPRRDFHLRNDKPNIEDWKRPKRPSFLPPLDMSCIYSKGDSPESEAPQTPRLNQDIHEPNELESNESQRLNDTLRDGQQYGYMGKYETPRYQNTKVHIDMHKLFKQSKMINDKPHFKTLRRGIHKYDVVEDINAPDEESTPVLNDEVKYNTQTRSKPHISLNNVDTTVTPRDILTNINISGESRGLKAPTDYKLFHKEKIPSILHKPAANDDQPTETTGKLLNRKGKKMLRFNVETDIMKGPHKDPYRKQDMLDVPDTCTEEESAIDLSFSRPSTAKTDHDTWLPLENEDWKGDSQKVERWLHG